MRKVLYVYSGEGTQNSESDNRLIKTSYRWAEISDILREQFDLDLEQLWRDEIGSHKCPFSPVLTVVCQICLADVWQRWGYRPDAVVGHSIGELSAAFEAGLYSLRQILELAVRIGQVAAKLDGLMMHGTLTDQEIAELEVSLSSLNFRDAGRKHVTVSGHGDEMARFLNDHPNFTEMRPPHPWHHRDYHRYLEDLDDIVSGSTDRVGFVSGVSAKFESELPVDHWKRWLSTTIDFIGSMDVISERFSEDELDVVEIGFHPVLAQSCEALQSYTYASSMYRGENEVSWILHQRRKLDQGRFLDVLNTAIDGYSPGLDLAASLAYQDFTSSTFVEFSDVLEPFFPDLAPQDFYRYKTVQQLIDGFGSDPQAVEHTASVADKQTVVIAGMSCRFPAAAQTPAQFWRSLMSGEDQVRSDPLRGGFEAGFLDGVVSKFDHRYFNISAAEAKTMDPQQILALELTEMLWRDAEIDPETLDKKRVGVYIGVWNEEFRGDRSSVYYPTGTNPSIIASRISYHYDLRGPSWVSNTACSSSLVALHYACKDIEAGRVDYAIAGGVNMILGENFTDGMRGARFLSGDGRCKTFDDTANGYVRAEGGGLVLLVNRRLVDQHYAVVAGSAINQNGGRAQVITAPHPEAQEEVILDACSEAAIDPRKISYIECHGTGTKIGDPIEVSAIQNTIAKNRGDTCYLGSVKSNIGHLESAAGIAGLIKSVLILNHGTIPANLHFTMPNQFIDFDSYHLQVVAEETPIDSESIVGVSSFGFGGANAHVVLSGVEANLRKSVQDTPIPFSRERSADLSDYFRLGEVSDTQVSHQDDAADITPRKDFAALVVEAFSSVTNITEIDPLVELTDQGLDSLGATQFVTTLQSEIGVDLDADLLFDYPLMDQLVGFLESLDGVKPALPTPDTLDRATIEAMVSRVFNELTLVETIEKELELTDQGLDSMSATQFLTELESELHVSLDVDALFDYPLFDQLIEYLQSRLADSAT
jgi:acyl transferase domain-containing protein/acyl carrier protein